MEPSKLAEVVGLIVDALNYSEGQRFELAGRISSRLVMVPIGRVTSASVNTVQPVYQQPPIQSAPEPELPPGPVMIPRGNECECDACKKVVYVLGADIFENTKKKAFVDAFVPQNGAPGLLMPLDTWADEYGNLAIDCPLCKGTKTLWIKGHGPLPYRDVGGGQSV